MRGGGGIAQACPPHWVALRIISHCYSLQVAGSIRNSLVFNQGMAGDKWKHK